jgi:hypothetical protein
MPVILRVENGFLYLELRKSSAWIPLEAVIAIEFSLAEKSSHCLRRMKAAAQADSKGPD